VNIHADTPKAIQALAEAIDAQLSSLGSGVILDTFTGVVHIGAGIGYGAAQFAVPFPRLAAVSGAVGCYGTFLAAGVTVPAIVHAPGTITGATNVVDPTKWTITTAQCWVWNGTQYPYIQNTDITVCALAWGPPH